MPITRMMQGSCTCCGGADKRERARHSRLGGRRAEAVEVGTKGKVRGRDSLFVLAGDLSLFSANLPKQFLPNLHHRIVGRLAFSRLCDELRDVRFEVEGVRPYCNQRYPVSLRDRLGGHTRPHTRRGKCSAQGVQGGKERLR